MVQRIASAIIVARSLGRDMIREAAHYSLSHGNGRRAQEEVMRKHVRMMKVGVPKDQVPQQQLPPERLTSAGFSWNGICD
jgi:hypothetical protein